VYSVASGIIETKTNCGDRSDQDGKTTRRDRKERGVKNKWKVGEGWGVSYTETGGLFNRVSEFRN
jgi:hypothetical protein